MADKASDRRALFRSRIVGHGMARPEELVENPLNWRKHPVLQKEALDRALREVGWVQEVIVNQRTGRLIDGHLRVALARERGEEEVPVTYVDLSEEEEQLVLLTLDPLAAMAEADGDMIERLLAELDEKADVPLGDSTVGEFSAAVEEMLDRLDLRKRQREKKRLYTTKVKTPVYEPRGVDVAIEDLYDDSRARRLLEVIEQAEGVTDEEREFLRLAAYRFVEFRFDRIADYYAQASPEMQRLMEMAALVIVDVGRAIEDGLVRMVERLAQEYLREYGDGGQSKKEG